MHNIKTVRSYFRITTKTYRRRKRDNRSILWSGYKAVFSALRGEALDPISYCVCNKNKLVYIVNSKAACSSIKQSMLSLSGCNVNGEDYWDIHRVAADRGYVKNKLSEEEKRYYFFTFVRSPFTRLASLYLNKFCDQKNISEKGFEYKEYLGGIFDRNDSFERFLTKISRIPDVLCDRHFKPQVYLVKQEAVKIDFVGKFENSNEDYTVLRERFGLRELNVINQSASYNLRDLYTQKTLDLVATRYAEDIEQFGYKNEYDKLKAIAK